MFKLNKKTISAAEALGWKVSEHDDYFTFRTDRFGVPLILAYPKSKDVLDWALDLVDLDDSREVRKVCKDLCDVIRSYCSAVEDEDYENY